jgi:hypothetical protein
MPPVSTPAAASMILVILSVGLVALSVPLFGSIWNLDIFQSVISANIQTNRMKSEKTENRLWRSRKFSKSGVSIHGAELAE